MMFEGFEHKRIKTSGAEIALVQGGSGAPLLLLHGYPQTGAIWHKVAPALARRYTLVIPDLRGYGASSKPPTDDRHLPYSKRAMALDMVEVMQALGFPRFALAGHDRGARVTYRLALDHPARVERTAVLDIVPTIEQFERLNRTSARAAYHWYFLAQPAPFPETLIGKDPDYFLIHTLESWCGTPGAFTPDAMATYREAFRDPEVIHATCEDYRAGIDCDFDDADRKGGIKVAPPMLALWGRPRPAASWSGSARSLAELGARRARRADRLRPLHPGRASRRTRSDTVRFFGISVAAPTRGDSGRQAAIASSDLDCLQFGKLDPS